MEVEAKEEQIGTFKVEQGSFGDIFKQRSSGGKRLAFNGLLKSSRILNSFTV